MRPSRLPEVLPFEKGQRLKTLRNLGRLFAEMWSTSPALMLATIVLRVVVAIQPPLALLFTKFIIDEVVRQTGLGPLGDDWLETGRLNLLGLLLAGEFALVFGRDLIQRGIQVLDALQGELHSNRVSVALMRHAAALDLMHFEESSYQDKLERARRQAASRSTVLGQVFGQVQMVVTALAFSIGLLVYAPLLIVLMALSILPAVWGEVRFNRLAYWINFERSPERRQMEYLRQVGASAESAKEVKLFGLGDYLVGRFRVLADAIYRQNRKLTVDRAAWGAALGTLSTLAYYGAFAYVVWRTVNGEFSIGDLVFLSGSFGQLNGYFQQILIGFTQIAGQALYLDDLYSFFDIEPTIEEPANPHPFPVPLREGIVFHGVGFRYPGSERFVVRNLDLTIRAGETVALVGENGAGKTTIVKLMTRLYEAEEGRITIDGTDIRAFSSADLRRNVGVIFQDFLRYSFTARDNIGVGRIEEAGDLSRVTRSAEQSLAHEVIDRLPGRYEQQLGKQFVGGQDLSGGEWQKLAIARAYMREAQIIILDEPTAALDARAESEVFMRFKSLSESATALLISHRFSTVRMADRIVVIENGAVLEQGTHEELVALRGHYAELFELQAAGYR